MVALYTDTKSNEQVESPTDVDESKRAFDKIMRSVSVSEQSSLKMRVKLQNAGFDEGVIDAAINKAISINAINDERYCEFLFRNALAQGKGLRKAIEEADSLGIDYESLECMEDVILSGDDGMVERALEVLRRTRLNGKDPRSQALRKLVSKCYTYDIARRATRKYFDEIDESNYD